MTDANLLSPSVLAFVGDAVYELLARKYTASVNRPSSDLHGTCVKIVCASAQADAFRSIEPLLSENELSVFKRGRNFHTGNVPKNATSAQYHTATGLECLFGYLYLSGNQERAVELFNIIIIKSEKG